jgi:hypothetical protein
LWGEFCCGTSDGSFDVFAESQALREDLCQDERAEACDEEGAGNGVAGRTDAGLLCRREAVEELGPEALVDRLDNRCADQEDSGDAA